MEQAIAIFPVSQDDQFSYMGYDFRLDGHRLLADYGLQADVFIRNVSGLRRWNFSKGD